ncbi:MAG: HU family DNA-binding protein [Myxococcales bacterium]|nr:HU family DNA-binding protein [Myxococcales bacterium]
MATTKRMTKAQLVAELSEKTGLSKGEVQGFFDQLRTIIGRELGAEGPGEFVLPDLLKLKVKITDARPAHTGLDPFTKQEREFEARPAQRKVRATPVKALKDLVS